MKLFDVLREIDIELLQGELFQEINKIQYDSRKVEKGDVFVCITGFQTDGHKYAAKAIEAGATAIICEHEIDNIPEDVTLVRVENTRAALAIVADNYYGHPCKGKTMIGVTGTNGKTTTTFLIKSILEKAGRKVGLIGTIENRIGDRVLHTERTTPESLELMELFDEMGKEGVNDIVMEVSSHSLALHRVDRCRYAVGIFTNLTQDHLDYHKTMENYKIAKSQLFELSQDAVINIDDEASAYMLTKAKGKVLTFGIENEADLHASNVSISSHGVKFTLEFEGKKYKVELQIPGKFSIYNALDSIGACILLGVPMETILESLAENPGVPGRFQTVKSSQGITAIVDYAHTPDSLENILNTAHEFVKGRIITVFGCGGDRDKTKRPIMGEIGGRLSDYCIITSDNPRTEEPAAIVDDVEVGIQRTNCPYEKEVDRKKAIFRAVAMAKPEDLVVVAGKGHENYQVFKDKTIHFDDVEVICEAFKEENK